MKLKKLRVQNYKCIEDSNEIDIDQVTYFVGKNEAGKSSLLEALYRLKPVEEAEANFRETDFPRKHVSTYRDRHGKDPANVLTTVWKIENDDRAALEKALGVDPLLSEEVTITKGYKNERVYSFEFDERKLVASLMENSPLSAGEKAAIEGFATVAHMQESLKAVATRSEAQNKFLSQLNKAFGEDGDAQHAISVVLFSRIPMTIFFKDYQRLPGRVSMNDLKTRKSQNALKFSDRIFMALLDLTNSSPDDVGKIKTTETLIMELEAIENRLTDEIFHYWTQNTHLRVRFRFDPGREQDPPPFNSGEIFSTRIENTRHHATVNFEERSSGFVWFFSFLVWFSQVKKNYGDNVLILLDEPGLTLHGKAQKDLLRYINERLRPHHQVLYTTHSPFMIDIENIFSLRTVEDHVEKKVINGTEKEFVLGTKVGQKVLSRDRDTILPLQGILGFDIADTMFIGPYVLVVEGPSEAAYINWFSRFLLRKNRTGLDLRWAIAPAESANKITSFVTLFSGRGLKIATLFDYHDSQKRMVEQLEASGLLPNDHVLRTTTFAEQVEADIEDLLGRELYVDLVGRSMGLQSAHVMPKSKPAAASIRLVKEAEDHCRTLPPGYLEFGHYRPAEFLLQLDQAQAEKLPGLDVALGRFEKLFQTLNKLI